MTTKRTRPTIKFSTHDLAALVGRHVETVRDEARRGLFDRRDLGSLVRYVAGHQRDQSLDPSVRAAFIALGLALGVDKPFGPKESLISRPSPRVRRVGPAKSGVEGI